ncbi:hypothetical protein GQ457_08G037160 [Hibiscus cannabinus]
MVGKETEDAAISNRVDWLLSELDQFERSLGQGDREMEPSEHVVDPTIQWSDNATCENRIHSHGFTTNGFWNQLHALSPDNAQPWVIGGDLNVISSSLERRGGSISQVGVCFSIPIPKLYRYMAAWKSHPDFHNLVSNVWDYNKLIQENIVTFKKNSTTWNSEVFGHIGKQKASLLARIRGAERALENSTAPHLVRLEARLKADQDSVRTQEENY